MLVHFEWGELVHACTPYPAVAQILRIQLSKKLQLGSEAQTRPHLLL